MSGRCRTEDQKHIDSPQPYARNRGEGLDHGLIWQGRQLFGGLRVSGKPIGEVAHVLCFCGGQSSCTEPDVVGSNSAFFGVNPPETLCFRFSIDPKLAGLLTPSLERAGIQTPRAPKRRL